MLNKVQLIGNLGKDPEIKEFENGNKVANFSIATSESYKNKSGERVTNTEWHNVTVFGNLVDIIEKYVKKGSKIYIEGKLKTRSWEKDGEKKYITEIVLEQFRGGMVMLDSKPSSEEPQEKDDLDF
ncbi:MAG: single-stranded DNA-binding protein [Bacteroidetes bacterium]|nr:MAG: single-stranded DNA-binding protein [Bacteroidota bacterium]